MGDRRALLAVMTVFISLHLAGCVSSVPEATTDLDERDQGVLSALPRALGGTADECEPVTLSSDDAVAVARANGLEDGVGEWLAATQLYNGRCAWVVTGMVARRASNSVFIDSETGEVLGGFYWESE